VSFFSLFFARVEKFFTVKMVNTAMCNRLLSELTWTTLPAVPLCSLLLFLRRHNGENGRSGCPGEHWVLPVVSPVVCHRLPQICALNGRQQLLRRPGEQQHGEASSNVISVCRNIWIFIRQIWQQNRQTQTHICTLLEIYINYNYDKYLLQTFITAFLCSNKNAFVINF